MLPHVAKNNAPPVCRLGIKLLKQQKMDQHALMKQVSLLNKQLALLRANQVSNPKATPKIP